MIAKFTSLRAFVMSAALALTPVLAFAADQPAATPSTPAADAAKPVQPMTKATDAKADAKVEKDKKAALVKPEVKKELPVKTEAVKSAPAAIPTSTTTPVTGRSAAPKS
ncbi:MAG TPA: hypothetical protein VM689_27090 [Aliidongia sp.]|nr:hypothetical protein [Aliidongia sp.]